jgi:excinuclease UvrABC nuclease subunit
MPFNSNSGYEFCEAGIARYAPIASGVYGIYNGRRWIYIGEAQDIAAHLRAIVRGESDESAGIMPECPAYFIWEKCDSRLGAARKAELVREHRPSCNLT